MEMIDIYDSETLVKAYRMLKKKCKTIDGFIENHATYFGPVTAEYGALDVYANIIDLMTKKNQLINVKIILDNAVKTLDEKDKKILFIKMNYHLQMSEICAVLEIKERTAFRRIERAFENLTVALNKSKHANKLEKILTEDEWFAGIKEDVKERRQSFCKVNVI